MATENNIDLDYLFNDPAQTAAAKAGAEKRKFYGQDGELPNKWDLLTWSAVFVGMFVFFVMDRAENPENQRTFLGSEVVIEEKI